MLAHQPLMQNGAVGGAALRALALALAMLGLYACEDAERDSTFSEAEVFLTSDLVLGADIDAAPEFQFVWIQDLLPLDDGSFWVVDGLDEQDASIRRYNASGEFLGHVSGAGDGPGDFKRPMALARLQDGRVLLTDQLFPRRLSLFNPDGTLNTVVSVLDAHGVGPGGRTFVDDGGLIWRWAGLGRPGPDRTAPFWSRMRVDGTVVDTVHPPQLPQLNRERVTYESADGRVTRGFTLPYRPRAYWEVTRSGRFLVVPRDEYRVYRLGGVENREGAMESFISRDVPRVAVSPSERAALREETRAQIADFANERELSLELEVPEVPSEKPFIRGLTSLRDGGVMVEVSMPSVQKDSGWVEPNGWDVFDRNGRFRGRVALPDGHRLLDAKDGNVWTVFTDELGIRSIHRHPLPF